MHPQDGLAGGDIRLGWTPQFEQAWRDSGALRPSVRVARVDRGWSSVLAAPDEPARVRNIGAEVAVGDWVVVSPDDERVEAVLPRASAFTRRASFIGDRAEADTIAANIDTVGLVHALTSPPNPRRLERELVLAFDSGAAPVIVLTKGDLVDEPADSISAVDAVAAGVPVLCVSGITGTGVPDLRAHVREYGTMALLGASGVGKSTLVNALAGRAAQRTSAVREGDQRGRHTTNAVELVSLPDRAWLIDTPGVRAVSLWASGQGIERAFADVFDVAGRCRFRDCKHEDEPGCAVLAAVEEGALDVRRVDAMKRLVAEEQALEEEQKVQERLLDRRGVRRPRAR